MKNLSIRQIKCLITLILAVFLCGAPAVAQTQKIAVKLDMTKVPMKTVMNEIEKQTKYLFLYTDEIDTERIVSIKADSKPLNEVLPLLFKDTDITYEITVPNIVLSKRVAAARPTAISGVVKDSGGLGIIGATVLIKGTTVGTTTGIDGDFALTVPASVDNPELSVSFIGYETRVVRLAYDFRHHAGQFVHRGRAGRRYGPGHQTCRESPVVQRAAGEFRCHHSQQGRQLHQLAQR